MALFDYEITDADIGRALDPPSGFLVENRQIRPTSVYVAPYGYNGIWASGYFQIRGALDQRDLVCVNRSQGPAWDGHITGRSIAYHGLLKILCVPVGSMWKMTLSDVAMTTRELAARAEALSRAAMVDRIAAIRAGKSNARTADALLEAARQR
jgi:hypothetical protein